MLQLLFELQEMLAEIAGLDAVSLQPAAGAHGELTALMVAAAYFRDRGEKRTKVLAPDSAHGTNPASAAMAGFRVGHRSRALRKASSISTICERSSTDSRRVHDYQSQHAGNVRTADARNRRTGSRTGGLIYSGRRQHERHSGHRSARRFRRRHDALQSAQNVQRPARRRRPRRGADCGAQFSGPYLPTPMVEISTHPASPKGEGEKSF